MSGTTTGKSSISNYNLQAINIEGVLLGGDINSEV